MTLDTQVWDERLTTVRFVLQLRDGFTGSPRPAGEVTARLKDRQKGNRLAPVQKYPDATFVFTDLPPGDYTIEARSNESTKGPFPPYYFDIDVELTVPADEPADLKAGAPPIWPGFPSIGLVTNRDLPLDDPAHPRDYREQRRRATLQPTVSYPFPDQATLVRGTVLAGKVPLKDALVRRRASRVALLPGNSYTTGEDGQFVIFLHDFPQPPTPKPSGWRPEITLTVSHADFSPQTVTVEVRRAMTVAKNVQMKP